MSTSAKLGLTAISSMLAAYNLGVKMGAPGAFTAWRTYLAFIVLIVCAIVFLRHLFCLHSDLTLLNQTRPLRRRDGKWLIP